jgi:hypothetical protein
MQLPSWHRHISNRGFCRRSQSKGQLLRSAAGPQISQSSGAVCIATSFPVLQGRFAPPCFAGQSVPGLRRPEAAHLKHRWSLCRRLVCQRLKSERPPLQFAKYVLPHVLVAQPRQQYKVFMATTSAQRLRSNWSFNRSANGWPPCPRGAACLSCASRAKRPSAVARLTLR